MSNEPWKDWIPGVLSHSQMEKLCKNGDITNQKQTTDDELKIGSSSIDLHLTDEGYEMVQGSVKPFGDKYLFEVKKNELAKELQQNDNKEYLLDRRKNYLFKITE